MLMEKHSSFKVYKSIMETYGIIFIAIVVSIVAASLYVSNMGSIFEPETNAAFFMQLAAIAVTLAFIPVGYIFSQRMIKNIEPALSVYEKLLHYQKALKLRFTSMLATAFLVSFFFFLTANTNLMIILAIVLLFYLINKPNPFKTTDDLNLSPEDKQKLMGK